MLKWKRAKGSNQTHAHIILNNISCYKYHYKRNDHTLFLFAATLRGSSDLFFYANAKSTY